MNPRWPIYVVSKGRWESRKTVRALDAMRVPCKVIVEEQEHDAYASVIDRANLLVLDRRHVDDYDACCAIKPGESKGSGPARNFAWDHAAQSGCQFYWCVDDNIAGFLRWNRNAKVWAGDGTILRCMEDFTARFSNVAMAGPNYEFFVLRKERRPPITLNTRIYSCNLIRTAAPFRWRCRYNEDTDLSLRMLKAGWCTVLFNAFLQKKTRTLAMKGGNTDEVYEQGRGNLAKSRMLAALHPDVATVTRKYGRWHHDVDYAGFRGNVLRPVPGLKVRDGVNDYGMRVLEVGNVPYGKDWRTEVQTEVEHEIR